MPTADVLRCVHCGGVAHPPGYLRLYTKPENRAEYEISQYVVCSLLCKEDQEMTRGTPQGIWTWHPIESRRTAVSS
jgi:hypothetical protein